MSIAAVDVDPLAHPPAAGDRVLVLQRWPGAESGELRSRAVSALIVRCPRGKTPTSRVGVGHYGGIYLFAYLFADTASADGFRGRPSRAAWPPTAFRWLDVRRFTRDEVTSPHAAWRHGRRHSLGVRPTR
jgi:hypothetical protein